MQFWRELVAPMAPMTESTTGVHADRADRWPGSRMCCAFLDGFGRQADRLYARTTRRVVEVSYAGVAVPRRMRRAMGQRDVPLLVLLGPRERPYSLPD